jgi:autotransporter adhesin
MVTVLRAATITVLIRTEGDGTAGIADPLGPGAGVKAGHAEAGAVHGGDMEAGSDAGSAVNGGALDRRVAEEGFELLA